MDVYVDADGCPVVDITVRVCKASRVPCFLFCDTAHQMSREGAKALVFDKGADSVDLAIAARVRAGDGVITQDYGLAAMCLSKGAWVLHQDGWFYTQDNIDALLFQRYESKKYRMSGGRIKGPHKRTNSQNKAFEQALLGKLQQSVQG